jgi:hypothetical protein
LSTLHKISAEAGGPIRIFPSKLLGILQDVQLLEWHGACYPLIFDVARPLLMGVLGGMRVHEEN